MRGKGARLTAPVESEVKIVTGTVGHEGQSLKGESKGPPLLPVLPSHHMDRNENETDRVSSVLI